MRVAIWGLVAVVAVGCGRRDRDAPPGGVGSAAPAPNPRLAPCDRPGATACRFDEVVECLADGTFGKTVQTCDTGCRQGACVDSCAVQGVELVYVLDSGNNLASFDPSRLPDDPFRAVGKLACDDSTTPFSMAVDREGVAWVLYNSGKVYRVSISDASCSRAVYSPGPGRPVTFGMGFVSDGPNAPTEKLFVAADNTSRALARLDVTQAPPAWVPIATIEADQTRNPELTGTGDGALFGYFPEQGAGFIQELDRTTGQPIGSRLELGPGRGQIDAWAFAHWGGVFYVFATVDGEATVHAVNRKTGAHEIVRDRLPRRIVGAGVSTCAPLLELPP